jgi:pyroglutamyl-peptidase
MKILVTGFDPFGGDPINPAFEAVRKLPKMIAGAEIEILEVPTVFHKSIQAVTEALDKGSFDAVSPPLRSSRREFPR